MHAAATFPLTGLLAACLAATLAPGPALAAEDWGATLEADLRALHAALLDSHPGPVDELNPAFTPLLDQGLATGLGRVPHTRDYAGYWWAMREFQASFNDGHVQFLATERAPGLETRWPGFLTREAADGTHLVAVRADDPGLPPVGTRITGCDGTPANALARERVGRFRGRWELAAQRTRHAPRMLLDEGNPWTVLPSHCTFTDGARTWTHALDWRPIPGDAVGTMLDAAGARHQAGFGLRDVEGLAWVAMGGFNGDPASADHAALTALVSALESDAALPRASRVVLDLRGNDGGSSHWSRLVAARLWGDEAVAAAEGGSTAVDWRASAANVAALQDTLQKMQAVEGVDPAMLRWVGDVTAGMQEAHARGDMLWREPDWPDGGGEDGLAPEPDRLATGARVYVLTDSGCASACLDAVDLWRSLGALHVGQETSADTVYMDLREQALPSGYGIIRIPMKVYRGRARGNNEPHVPDHPWEGDIGDDAAIAAHIRTL